MTQGELHSSPSRSVHIPVFDCPHPPSELIRLDQLRLRQQQLSALKELLRAEMAAVEGTDLQVWGVKGMGLYCLDLYFAC